MENETNERGLSALINKVTDIFSGKEAPKYIEYGGNIVLEPPYKLVDCLMYCFLFKSSGGKALLQDLLDQRLNFASEQSNLRYEAVMPEVMLTYSTTPRSFSIPQQNLGYTIENELCTWVLTVEKIKKCGSWVDNRLVWFVPYITVDNIYAVAAGRETYGFPKILGRNNIPTDPKNAGVWESFVPAFKTYSPNECLKEYPLMSIRKEAHAEGSVLEDADSFFKTIKEQFANKIEKDTFSWRFCINETIDLLKKRIDCVFLKQFRDSANSNAACYQAIVNGAFQITTFKGGGLLGLHNYSSVINDLASFPMAKELGLEKGQKSELAFFMKTDFDVPLSKELWRA